MEAEVGKFAYITRKEDEKFDLSSSGRAEWTVEGCSRDLFIDPENSNHIEWLQAWCRAHWLSTFKRALMYGNALYYHKCCNCFSRRTFSVTSGHPCECTVNIRKVPGFKEVESATSLFVLLLEMINQACKEGKKILFPSINRRHYQLSANEKEMSLLVENAVLAKRCDYQERDLQALKEQVQVLQIDNQRLLESSKTWCWKYQALLDQQEAREKLLDMPKKSKLSKNHVFIEDD